MANLSNINNKFIVADVATATRVSIGITTTNNLLTLFGTGAGNATLQIEGESGADPYINFLANNAQHWSLGVDDSDSDKFKLSEHSALGTNDYFVVDTSGKVGIGTDSPSSYTYGSNLAIKNTGSVGITIQSDTTGASAIQFADGDSGAAQYRGGIDYYHSANVNGAAYYSRMDLRTNGAQRITILGSGNVGIATTSPDAKLDVQSSGSWGAYGRGSSGDINVENTNTSVNEGGWIGIAGYTGNTANSGFFPMAGITAKKSTASGDGNYGGDLSFWTTAGTGQSPEANSGMYQRMTINRFGNVGIGTTSPGALLNLSQANGANIRFDNETTTNYFTIGEGVGTNNVFSFRGNSYRSTDTLSIDFVNDRVGIGTISPATKLDVYQGDIRRSGIVSGGYIEIGSLPGYGANAYQSLTSGGTIHFANNGKYCAYLEGANTYFGILNSSSQTKVKFNTNGDSFITGGNVGIGTTSPNNKLEISDTGVGTGSTHLKISRGADATAVQRIAGIKMGNTASNDGSNWIIQADSSLGYFDSANLDFIHNAAGTANTKMRIESDGTIRAKTGSIVVDTAGQGIYLGGTATANKLDDYEEGTWTPSITAVGGNSATASYHNPVYTKVGEIVNVAVYIHTINIAAITSGTYIQITGLPFTAENYGDFTASYHSGGWSGGAIVGGYVQDNGNVAYLMRADGTEAQQTSTDLVMTRFMLNVTYQTT